jgi:hypothetical protein
MTLLSCYANSCTGGGYILNKVSYSALIACACDNADSDGYTQSGGTGNSFSSCGIENGQANGFRLNGGNNSGLYHCYSSGNAARAFWVTGVGLINDSPQHKLGFTREALAILQRYRELILDPDRLSDGLFRRLAR